MLREGNGCKGDNSVVLFAMATSNKLGVSNLVVEEELSFEPDRVVELVVTHGELGTQRLVDDTMREIATLCSELVHRFQCDNGGDANEFTVQVRKIEAAARAIGLPVFQHVVQALSRCYQSGDRNAQAALQHRLVRLVASALRRSWDLSDHFG